MDTKAKILEQAWNLYRRRGFSHVTVNEICTASEITKPTFYNYFKNKEDTITHIYDDITEGIVGDVPQLILAANYYEQLRLCFQSLVKQSADIGVEIISQMFRINLEDDLGSFDFRERFSAVCIAITQRGQEAGQFFNTGKPRDLYEALCYAFSGYEVTWCIKNGDFDFEKEMDRAIQTIYMVDPKLYS